jgi:signal transduction histidine kinase
MVVSLMPSLRRTPYQITVEVPKTGLLFDSFPGPLGQVLGNLINNAVLHGFDGRPQGTIRITGERVDASHVVLRVIDDGNGIAPDMLERIFEPFVTTKMGRGGTGLGLHIAYNAVTCVLGGTRAVHSVLGQGATFELRGPLQAPLSA